MKMEDTGQFRKWATPPGGVYVPPFEHTPPDPCLYLPDCDVVTSKGLTLMPPACMQGAADGFLR